MNRRLRAAGSRVVSGRFGLRGGPVLIGRSVLACDCDAAARVVEFAENEPGPSLSVRADQ